jgi:photosystem II stability/assembly factor-like uncharacterized protein
MTTPNQPATPARPWYVKHQRALLIVGGIIAFFVVIALLSALTPPPAWSAPSQNIGHPLAVVVDPAHAGTVDIGTEQGKVYSSADGQTWTDQSAGLPSTSAVSALAFSADGSRLLAGTSTGVYAYNAASHKWAASSSGLPTGEGVDALAFAATDGQTVLAGTEHHAVYRSADGGKTWSSSAGGLAANADIYGLTVLPDNKTVYAAVIGGGVYRSGDGGMTWTAASTGLPANVDAFSVVQVQNPQTHVLTLLVGTSQGVFRSENSGAHWASSSAGLGTTRAISLAVDTRQAGFVIAGTDAGAFESFDGGAHWHTIATGLPVGQPVGVVAIAAPSNNSQRYYAAADRIYTYPGYATPITAWLIRGLVLAVLIGVIIWMTGRQRRIMQGMTPEVPAPSARARRAPGQPAARPSATSHIRGGPPSKAMGHIRGGPPAPPPTPDEAGEKPNQAEEY